MNPRQNLIRTSPAFALISVLALVSLAALTATAFLASARLEKTAAMTIGDQTRLTLALDSGYHLASYTFTKGDNTWNWADFLVGEDTDGVGYLYHAVPYAGSTATNVGQWYNYATFSCATLSNIGVTLVDPTNYSATTTWQGGFASNRLDASSRLSKLTNFSTTDVTPSGPVTRIPLLFSRTSPIVNWITNYFTNPTTLLLTPSYRFAYFTEDLSGLIDAERMGGSSSRTSGTNPNEIALGEIGLINLAAFTNLRPMFLNPGLIESVIRTNGLTNGSVTNPWRYLASGTYSLNSRLSTTTNHRQGYLKVPSGLGYPVADTNANAVSTNKLNLNTLFNGGVATATALSEITAAITNNLSNFTNRAGGMAGGTYVSNIAANIVDLFDTDNFATTVGQSVRGVDSYPFVNEIWDRVELKNINVNTSVPTNWVVKYDLEITTWMELWNMSSQPVTNGSMRIFYRNREVLTNRTSGATDIPSSFTNSLNYTTNVTLNFTTNFLPTNPTLSDLTNSGISPNSYHMVSFPKFTTNLSISNISSTNLTKTNLTLLWATNGNLNGYATYFSSNSTSLPSSMVTSTSRVDSSSSAFNGIQRNTNDPEKHFLDSSQTVWWRGNATPNSDLKLGLTGDPRIMFHLSPTAGQTWWDHQFDSQRASWWARNTMGKGADKFTVNLNLWPEYNHNSSSYPNTTNPAQDPLSITMRSQETNKPVQIIYNSPPTNIIQLGQTLDPMQWSYNVTNNTNGLPLTGATAANSSGGGHTLRIGRAEHPRFAWTNVSGQAQPNMQASAAALLDLFCTDINTSAALSGRFDDGDQININTAPPRVLRALAAGIILTNDPALQPSNNYVIPITAIDAFVKGVTNFRAKYPFYSASQLAFIGTDASWPNTGTWPTGAVFTTNTMGITAGNDAAVEEWFSKIYALSKVQTRNYRIYVQAQLIKTRGTNTNLSNLTFGAVGRRYYDVLNQQNNPNAAASPSCSVYLMRKVDY